MAHNSYTMSTRGLLDMYNLGLQVYISGKPLVSSLQPGRVIRIILVIWVTFCPGQSGFCLDILLCLTRIIIFSYQAHQKLQ